MYFLLFFKYEKPIQLISMKKPFLLFAVFVLFLTSTTMAQGLSVNTSGNPSDPSAILDVSSSTQGLLIPRMVTADILAISNPATGLLVLNTDNKQLMQNIGTPAVPDWRNISYNSSWDLNGNVGTNPAINFIGTTDSTNLIFRVNNQIAGNLVAAGNIFLGIGSGPSNTTGMYNVAIGKNSLHNNSIASYVVAIGEGALYNNGIGAVSTQGSNNTAVGALSLHINTTGQQNTAVGTNAMYGNTNGIQNTAIGYNSLYNDSTGIWNTAVGVSTLSNTYDGWLNTALGAFALQYNTYGSSNTGVGTFALQNNTIGGNNTAMGYLSLSSNISASYNTAVGSLSLYYNSTGQYNTAIGYHASFNGTTGAANTSLGYEAAYTATSGNNNTSLGERASLLMTTGQENVSVGEAAGFNLTTGSDNVAVGTGSGNAPTGIWNNTSSINNGGTTPILNAFHNQVFLGNTSVTYIGGQVTWSTYSDERIKRNIVENVPGLAFIQKLKPVTYNLDITKQAKLTGNELGPDYPQKYDIEKMTISGFLAQDVEKAALQCGYNFSGVRAPVGQNQLYSLSYEQFVVPLVKGMQEQQALIEIQNNTIRALKYDIQQLNNRLNILETTGNSLIKKR